MKELNETQRKMYEYLAEQAQKGVVPSVREIGEHVGLKSTGSVQRYLERLEEAGYIGPARGSKPREILKFYGSD